jgi:hypothetical protein
MLLSCICLKSDRLAASTPGEIDHENAFLDTPLSSACPAPPGALWVPCHHFLSRPLESNGVVRCDLVLLEPHGRDTVFNFL